MTTKRTIIVLIVALALAAAACSSGSDADGSWEVVEMRGPGGNLVSPSGITITLEVSDGKFSGNAGCNEYFGEAALDGGGTQVGMTLKMCEDSVMLQEDLYVSLLGEITSVDIDGDTMTAMDSAGETLVVFRAV